MNPTPEQLLAIDIRNTNVLVSAAAGSGKTSVLVNRVVQRVTGEKDGVDIDRLLIMTFTNAAAAEMAGRIRDSIEDLANKIRQDKDHDREALKRIEKQAILVHNAKITTIHGFCKGVISDHFDKVSLDPNFRVADENECKLIKHEALEECIEAGYEKADPAFLAATRCFSNSKTDAGFEKLIEDIYDFVIADPDPEGFIKECTSAYLCETFDEFASSPCVSRLGEYLKAELAGMEDCLAAASRRIEECEYLAPYKDCIDGYMDVVSHLRTSVAKTEEARIYDTVRNALKAADPPGFGRISSKNLDDQSKKDVGYVASLRDQVKTGFAKLLAMMPFDLETTYETVSKSKDELLALTDAVIAFMNVYAGKKREKNIIDFNDMEHMAVSILSDPDIADIYRSQFEEIYVDEYQDTNMTQEMLVSLICRQDPGNVFQVGDVKQSIYRFRHARPDIFLGKYNTYGDDMPNRRILLNDNFRSRREVIMAVNEVFRKIMRPELGGIDYNEEAELVYAASYYDKCTDEKVEGCDYKAELILGDPEEISSEEFTANVIAGRINRLMDEGFMVYDKGTGSMRPAQYRDFTILVRSVKKYEPVFREVFEGAGIPLAVSGSEGYYKTVEIQTALSFLAVVDNPYDDISMTALMRSPVGGFSDVELAGMTAGAGADIPIYDRVRKQAENDSKCIRFLELLDHYRAMSSCTPVHNLLEDFIDNVYGDHVRCMTKGQRRMANLEMLLAKAQDYGRTSFKGLYQFMRYIDQIKKYELDEGEAVTESENDNVVRLMTMHASKGLEFPICFLAGIEKKRNTADESGKVVWNPVYGFGIDHMDPDRHVTVKTLPKALVSLENRLEGLAEEIRVLYVAMTRAREKLIMVGCDKPDGFDREFGSVANASSYLEMLKAAYQTEGFEHINIKYTDEKALTGSRVEKEIRSKSMADQLLDLVHNGEVKKDIPVSIPSYLDGLSFVYPHRIDPERKAKYSVSELKHSAIEERMAEGEILTLDNVPLFNETNPEKYIPRFARKDGETAEGGTFHGTAFHRIMELWDYSMSSEEDSDGSNNTCYITDDIILGFISRMRELHRMDKAMTDAIRCKDVADFLNSSLGARMRKAAGSGTLFREQPFVVGIDVDDETVLVQGIIDAYFVHDGKITIVDYKTDRVSDEEMLTGRYRAQLEYYGRALSQITKLPIASLTIWSTHLGREINMEYSGNFTL